jgi:hypothetical protein
MARWGMHLAVDGDNALDGFGELCHEPLEHGGELLRVKQAQQAAEGVVAGQAILELEEATQEGLHRHGERRYVGGTLTATQDGAQGDHQKFVQVVQTALPVRGYCNPSKQAINWSNPASSPGRGYAGGRIYRVRIGQMPIRVSRKSKCDSPEDRCRFPCGQPSGSFTLDQADLRTLGAPACLTC